MDTEHKLTKHPPMHILLVEDDEEDYYLTREMLAQATGLQTYQISWVQEYDDALRMMQNEEFDAVVVDYRLGGHTGIELIRAAGENALRFPLILLTGQGNYAVDVEAMNAGVTDYLVKGEIVPLLLERTIRYAILRRRTEDALRAANETLEQRVIGRTQALQQKNAELEVEILERRRVQHELAEVRRRTLERSEEERSELARELHDGPMQDLYGVIYSIDTMAESENGVEELRAQLLKVVQNLRTISRDLRPPALAPYGLEKAIRSHLESLNKNAPEISITPHLEPDGLLLPEPIRIVLYRIYQVAVTNVLRHAQARHLTVNLHLTEDCVIMEIQDDGQGFVVPRRWVELARQDHLGLVGAAERAEAVGGSLMVESTLGKGSLIRVSVPRIPMT